MLALRAQTGRAPALRGTFALLGWAAISVCCHPCAAAEAARSAFGELPGGVTVEAVELSNIHGIKVRVITLGATVQSIVMPDRHGVASDITLGYDRAEDYLRRPHFFGATIGRYANRIAQGRFTLDGKTYQLPINSPPNTLHGGPQGFDKVVWRIERVGGGAAILSTISPDGDQGFPGTLRVQASFTLLDTDELTVEYQASTDAPTVVNLTNHVYFNLSGGESPDGVLRHVLTIPAEAYTPVDANLIPTGEFRNVGNTPFDFRVPHAVGLHIRADDEQLHRVRGYDHNFVISRKPAAAIRSVARVVDPDSGRQLEISSDQPGIQLYTGNFFDGTVIGKGGRAYRQGDALVLEPQGFPDTPNHMDFGSARLAPGETYRNRIVYRFSVNK